MKELKIQSYYAWLGLLLAIGILLIEMRSLSLRV
jgi:hypothetical protein